MKTELSFIWSRAAVSISYDANHFTISASTIYIHTYIKAKLVTLDECDPKAPFSIATTPRCKGRSYSMPWIAPFYPWSLPYKAEVLSKVALSIIFDSLVWLDLGLNPDLANYWRTLYLLGHLLLYMVTLISLIRVSYMLLWFSSVSIWILIHFFC